MVFNYRRFTVSYMEWQEWKQLLKLHAMRGARAFAQCAPLELKLIKHCAGH